MLNYLIVLLLLIACYAGFTYWGYQQIQTPSLLHPLTVPKDSQALLTENQQRIATGSYDSSQLASATTDQLVAAKLASQKAIAEDSVGRLVIPKVELELPILAGVNETNLLSGATMLSADQQMGQDNYVLMAHSILDMDVLLYRIKDLQQGDDLYITDGVTLYRYQVSSNQVVDQSQGELLQTPKDHSKIITLFRCEGDVGTRWRRVVQGRLTSQTKLTELSTQQQQAVHLADVKLVESWSQKKAVGFLSRLAIYNIQFFLKAYRALFMIALLGLLMSVILLVKRTSKG